LAGLTRTFFDTSVLLGGTIDAGASAREAQTAMDAVADGRVNRPTTAWHCCLEYYAVVTRLPEELRLSPAAALQLLEEEVLGRFEIVDLPPGARLAFLRSAATQRVVGGRLYDAHIAEIARRSGAEVVVTENLRHFPSAPGHSFRAVSAATFVRELTSNRRPRPGGQVPKLSDFER
jgi:predicted nucleic acid-binding protein